MSDLSLTLVLQFKTSTIFNDMAKVSIKSEKITPFGGIFHVMEQKSWGQSLILSKINCTLRYNDAILYCTPEICGWCNRGEASGYTQAPHDYVNSITGTGF